MYSLIVFSILTELRSHSLILECFITPERNSVPICGRCPFFPPSPALCSYCDHFMENKSFNNIWSLVTT